MMPHSFERFGLTHLSASSLNLWRSAPGLFALRYIAGIKDDGNAAMWRGSAVENGLARLLRGGSLADAVEAAHQSFDLNAANAKDDTSAERSLIAPMIERCSRWQPPSELNATQLRVEYWFDPIPIPIIGYLDFAFDCGIDIDLKTTKACPSDPPKGKPTPSHVRQVALYRAARGRDGGILYVSHARHAYFPVDDAMMEIALEELRSAALSLNNFLARCDSRDDAIKSLPIDWEHFQAPKTRVSLSEILMAG